MKSVFCDLIQLSDTQQIGWKAVYKINKNFYQ